MTDANSVPKRISIGPDRVLTVQDLRIYLEDLDSNMEVAVLRPRAGLNPEIYPPEMYRVSSVSVDSQWEMLDLRIEKVLDDGE